MKKKSIAMGDVARKSSAVFDHDRAAQVAALANKVFARPPKRVAFPGGTSRSAFIADMGDAPYVFARRGDKDDAQLEGIVLRTLGQTGHVPKLKAVVDEWVVQEYIPGIRLPVLLDETADMKEREGLVSKSLESLLHIHEEARISNLHHRVPKVGTADKWLWNRTGAAKRVSKSLGIAAPDLDRGKLVDLMDVKRTEFIKWDARPGNAMVNDGRVIWFDWEDCGRSCALDDLAFVLCDEWTALDTVSEQRLEQQFLPLFNTSRSADQAMHYLRLFGVTHIILRLRMAVKLQVRDGKWWDRDYCLEGDKIGVTETETSRLIARGKRWASQVPEWQPIVPWLDDVAAHYGLSG